MSVFDEFLDIFGFGDSETPDIQGGPKYNKPKSDKSKKKGGTALNNEINDFLKKDPAERSLKDFYSLLGDISRTDRPTFLNPTKERLLVALNSQFPNRGAGDNASKRDALRTPRFEGFMKNSKGEIVPKPFEKDDITAAIQRGAVTKATREQVEKDNAPYEGPFGKLGEYFSKNADKRDELFDYISSVGQQLVRPTNPGEARGFLSDVSAGLGAGEAKIASKDAAALDSLVKRGQYAQATNPLQNYTSKMKEIRSEAINLGYEPGTKEYTDYVGGRLRGEGVSEEIKNTVDTLDTLRLQKVTSPDSAEQIDKQIKMLENKLTALSTGGTGTMGSFDDNMISYLGT
tara:strand:+ start:4801 stop:5835 length:1035 start_codon:yes stop_codon:yes gene_type:complete